MILYTTNCSKCNVLKKKLDDGKFIYDLCNDVDLMQEKGFMSVPMLELSDGTVLNFVQAINWSQKEVN